MSDRQSLEEKKFYHCFSIVKYPYLPIDTFRKYVERHVTRSKLTFKFTCIVSQATFSARKLLKDSICIFYIQNYTYFINIYIRMVSWNVVDIQDSAGMRITLQQPHY